MSRKSNFFKAGVGALLKHIPASILGKIEDLVQKQQGKGSGAWSTKGEAKIIADFAKRLQIMEVVAVDAGANLGNWTSELLRHIPMASVIAFEPSQAAFEKLQTRFTSDRRISCFNLALGKENINAMLYADKGGSGLGSLTKRRVQHFNIDFSHQEDVTIQTLDSWLSQNHLDTAPNVLKMDVEGHEYDLLLGATKTLDNIHIIQFEFGGSNIDTRIFFQDFWYFFQSIGFEIYRLTPSKPILIENYNERDEVFRATNFIAVRKNAS